MGYKVMYCAESEVFHLGGGTLNVENPFKTYLNFRNNLLLLQNNLPFWHGLFTIMLRIWMDLMAIFRFLGEGKRKDAWAVSRAHQNFVWNFFSSRRSVIKDKRLEVRSRKELLEVKSNHLKGMYKNSIVWDFFIKKKKHFTELDPENFY